MEMIQNRLRKFSHVVYVFAKIAYIASIVGLCLGSFGLVWTVIAGGAGAGIQLGGITLYGPLDAQGLNLAEIYGTLAYITAYCAFLIGVMRLSMRLFSNMHNNYTPFTMENAELFKRMAIRMIVASIVPAIVGYSVGNGCAKLMSVSFTTEYGDGFSLVTVLLLFAMSIVFRYGCALQEQADTTL